MPRADSHVPLLDASQEVGATVPKSPNASRPDDAALSCCAECGKELQPRHRFCTACGKPVEPGALPSTIGAVVPSTTKRLHRLAGVWQPVRTDQWRSCPIPYRERTAAYLFTIDDAGQWTGSKTCPSFRGTLTADSPGVWKGDASDIVFGKYPCRFTLCHDDRDTLKIEFGEGFPVLFFCTLDSSARPTKKKAQPGSELEPEPAEEPQPHDIAAPSESSNMTITVQDLFGTRHVLSLACDNCTIGDLKQKLHEAGGCPPDAQRLLFDKRLLEDEHDALITHGVKDGAMVSLTVQDEAAGLAARESREKERQRQQADMKAEALIAGAEHEVGTWYAPQSLVKFEGRGVRVLSNVSKGNAVVGKKTRSLVTISPRDPTQRFVDDPFKKNSKEVDVDLLEHMTTAEQVEYESMLVHIGTKEQPVKLTLSSHPGKALVLLERIDNHGHGHWLSVGAAESAVLVKRPSKHKDSLILAKDPMLGLHICDGAHNSRQGNALLFGTWDHPDFVFNPDGTVSPHGNTSLVLGAGPCHYHNQKGRSLIIFVTKGDSKQLVFDNFVGEAVGEIAGEAIVAAAVESEAPIAQRMGADDGKDPDYISARDIEGWWCGIACLIFPWCASVSASSDNSYTHDCQTCLFPHWKAVFSCGQRYHRNAGSKSSFHDVANHCDNECYPRDDCVCLGGFGFGVRCGAA